MAVSQLPAMTWWSELPYNIEVRSADEFVAAISLPLVRAARIEIIDPYLLPSKKRYRLLLTKIVRAMLHNDRNPLLKFHTSLKAFDDRFGDKNDPSVWYSHFRPLNESLAETRRAAQVFVWQNSVLPDDFHERYLITEIGSCGIGRGFNLKDNYNTTFYRLDRETSNRIEAAFGTEPNALQAPLFRFCVGSKQSRWFF
jgi:hypothetical protein